MSSYDPTTNDHPGRSGPARAGRAARHAQPDDSDRGHHRGARGVPRGPRRGPGPAVPCRRAKSARSLVARRPLDRPRRPAAARRRPGRRSLMAILLDGSAVLAAADQADLNHEAALAWFRRADEPLLLGDLTLAELDVLLPARSWDLGDPRPDPVDHRRRDPARRPDGRRSGSRGGAPGGGGGAPAAAGRRPPGRDRRAPRRPSDRDLRPASDRGVPAPPCADVRPGALTARQAARCT